VPSPAAGGIRPSNDVSVVVVVLGAGVVVVLLVVAVVPLLVATVVVDFCWRLASVLPC
jgi:hypothetical protein